MCRSHNSGEPARRCPCTSSGYRSAYERGKRAADRAEKFILEEKLGLDLEPLEDTEIPYINEVTALATDISAMYIGRVKKRIQHGEDAAKLDVINALYNKDDIDVEVRMNAVIRLGFLLSQRAEEISGITAGQILENQDFYRLQDLTKYNSHYELVKEARAKLKEHQAQSNNLDKENETESLHNVIKKLEQELSVLQQDVHRNNYHPKTEAELDKLSQGYISAISEVRSVGGTMEWNNASRSPVVKMFDEAAQVYPSEWIVYSNQGMLPFARNLSSRAHYSHYFQKTLNVKKIPHKVTTQYPADYTPEDTHRETYTLLTDEEVAQERYYTSNLENVLWSRQYWQVDQLDGFFKRKAGGGGIPAGAGWVRYEWNNDDGKTLSGWRRKVMYKSNEEEQTISAPEIVTKLNLDNNFKNRSGFSTAIHELSHRFEATVPEITDMERDFYEYRTKNKDDGEQNPRFNMTPESKFGRSSSAEYAREGGFITKYMGKEYPSEVFEIMSCGMEGLFGYQYGSLIGVGSSAKDEHMRSFILGVLASAGRRYLSDDNTAE